MCLRSSASESTGVPAFWVSPLFSPLFVALKLRFRGLAKNTAQIVTLFALSNLWQARRRLLALTGEVRLQVAEMV